MTSPFFYPAYHCLTQVNDSGRGPVAITLVSFAHRAWSSARRPAPPLPPPVSGLEESRARLGTLLVLLGGGAARPYCSDEFIALDDRHSTPGG